MTTYRLYFLDYAGHIHEVRTFECEDDGEAAAKSRAQDDRRSMELWDGERLVRTFHVTPDEAVGHA